MLNGINHPLFGPAFAGNGQTGLSPHVLEFLKQFIAARQGGQPMVQQQLQPQQRDILRELLALAPQLRRALLQNLVQSLAQQSQQTLPQYQTQGQSYDATQGQATGQVGRGHHCHCHCHCHCHGHAAETQTAQSKTQTDANGFIKGTEKDGWLTPRQREGGWKRNKDGTFQLLKGEFAGGTAKASKEKGVLEIFNAQGQFVGNYKSPNGSSQPGRTSPLTFDLNGDGKVGTTSLEGGKKYDINGDGKVDQSAWAGKGDGVLAFDADGNGIAGESGKELLGNNTDTGDGKKHANGFEALKALAGKNLGKEAIADGKLDARELKALEGKIGLTMMVDGQKKSLSELGISEINLGYKEAGPNADENGNEHRQVGAGFVRNGKVGKVNDVWFKYK